MRREFSDREVARLRIRLIEAGIVSEPFAPAYKDLPEWRQQQWHQIAHTYTQRFYR